MKTDFERIRDEFNATAVCKYRRDGKPQLGYDPGCLFIECELERCSCRMNCGEGGPVSEFLTRWQRRHGKSS